MKATEFRAFFEELHGRAPFPWQTRLAERVAREGRWPDILDLPTGSGKTACIDIALFQWLVCASEGAPQRAARRIAFVVDRRIIVDEAAERAAKIVGKIAEADSPLLRGARETIHTWTSWKDGPPIDVVTLRGGIERENNLARDPTTLAVVLSTVDQLGSRLLFRGYGVSDGMAPVHAGLFGVDTHLLLDEAHIAEPFQQTLQGIVREQSRHAAGALGPKPLSWSRLSATPSAPPVGATVFRLEAPDHDDATLARRLTAKKPMVLVEVAKRDELPKKLAELVVEELARPPLSTEEAPRLGIVVNRVATARNTYDALVKALKGRADVELVIGRVRSLERDLRMKALAPRLKSDMAPRPGERPIVVVATQTIEVGADFDFHAMFIEAAGYSAIKQRVGRLNRLGARDAARGAIVLSRDDAADDPVYGNTIGTTWEVLREHSRDGVVDLGILAAPPATPATLQSPPATPFLAAPLLDLLVQTRPRPAVEPTVSEFLHGFADAKADVSIVWRDGLEGADGELDSVFADALVDALPALSGEAMSLPFLTFHQWARSWDAEKRKIADTGDLDGDYRVEEDVRQRSSHAVLVVRGDRVVAIPARQVWPGAKVILPSSYGGADAFGFAPERKEPVSDLSLAARVAAKRAPTLVWAPEMAKAWADVGADGNEIAQAVRALLAVMVDDDVARDDAAETVLTDWYDEWGDKLRQEVRDVLDAIVAAKRPRVRCDWLDVAGERRGLILRDKPETADLVDDEAGLQRTVRVTLASHSEGVAGYAERFARLVGLSAPLAAALRTAGYVHDLGKADPRFQARMGAKAGEVLAKSVRYDRNAPKGDRHEVYSVALIDRHPHLVADHPDHARLIRYLVGTHHGHGRAFHPLSDDRGIEFSVTVNEQELEYAGKPALDALSSGWTDLFIEMHRAYGPWGLAYLEAILRLADHRRSEDEVTGGDQ